MRVLLIGAGGFLGDHVSRRLDSAGTEIITAVRSASSRLAADLVVDLARDTPTEVGEQLADLHPDVVINCAGATVGSPEKLAADNVTAPATLVGALLTHAPRTRLIHLGSAAEYGATSVGIPIGEDTPPQPSSLYGVTKLAGTRLVQLGRTARLDAVVLRVFNPVGAGAPTSSLVGRVLAEVQRARAEGDAIRLGPLDAMRDFVAASDVADAVVAAANSAVELPPILNIGAGRAMPVRDLVKALLDQVGFTGPIHETQPVGSNRSASVSWQQACIATAQRLLSWQPDPELRCALAELAGSP
jgi:nucleoside-diphosphate-sugar epimerase